MSLDVIFQNAAATADLASILKVLGNNSKVDTQSESFKLVLDLSIRNGDQAVFTKLLTYMPELKLKVRSQAVEQSRQSKSREALWKLRRLLTISIVTETCFGLFCYYALSFALLHTAHRCSGQISQASAWWYDHLHSSASPFSVWLSFLAFHGAKQRFSCEFFLEGLDSALVFLGLGIAARFVPQSSWIGGCIYQARFSFVSAKGVWTRSILSGQIPAWRRTYFSIILGPDHSLATSARANDPAPETDNGEVVLKQLLRRKCNQEALMIQYLKIVAFDDINENRGAGYDIFMWAAENGYVQVVQNLLDLGIDASIEVSDSDRFQFGGPPSGSALFWAAAGGHANVIKILLRNGAEVKEDEPDHHPLIGATRNSHQNYDAKSMETYARCVSLLLHAGANPNAIDSKARSALSWSTQPAQKPLLALLLKAGADPNALDQELKLPLHYAARFARSQKIVQMLLPKTVNPNSVDKDGTSALTWALWSADCPPTIELLLDSVSEINLGGGIYGCPLGAASRYCSSTIVKMVLEKGANPNVMGDGHYGSCIAALLDRPFNSVVFEDDLLCLQLLLSAGAKPNLRMVNGKQALHEAAVYCHRPEIFEMLLRYDADVNGTFDSKERGFEVTTTPLGVLCDRSIRKEPCMVLLRAGANPNCYTPCGKTPLQSACYISGSSKIAKELIRKGADVQARSKFDGTTALHNAATAARSDMIKELIENGSNVAARDKWMRTPLHSACWRTQDRETQRERVENPWETRKRLLLMEEDFELRQTIELLLVLGQANPKARDTDGATPLHHAVKACNTSSTEPLIKLASADVIFEKDSGGKLPLHWAAEAGFAAGLHSLFSLYFRVDHTRQFNDGNETRSAIWDLQRYVNATDNSGNTPLHYAAQSGHENFITTLLLEPMPTDINLRNRAGYTALDLAKKENQVWVVAQLKEAEAQVKTPHTSTREDGRS